MTGKQNTNYHQVPHEKNKVRTGRNYKNWLIPQLYHDCCWRRSHGVSSCPVSHLQPSSGHRINNNHVDGNVGIEQKKYISQAMPPQPKPIKLTFNPFLQLENLSATRSASTTPLLCCDIARLPTNASSSLSRPSRAVSGRMQTVEKVFAPTPLSK